MRKEGRMMGWGGHEDGLAALTSTGVEVRIQSQTGLAPEPCTLPGSDFAIREWTTYNIVSDAPIEAVEGLGTAAREVAGARNVVTFELRNRVGRARFRVKVSGSWTPVCRVEVYSTKFPEEASHRGVMHALLSDLGERLHHAPFSVEASTHFGSEASGRATPLSDYHTLLHWADRLEPALDAILHDPHRTLSATQEWLRLDEITSIDADLLVGIARAPEQLERTGVDSAFTRRLRGYLPRRIRSALPAETYDTLENRFVAHVLRETSQAAQLVAATDWLWKGAPAPAQDRIRATAALADYTLASTFLGELPLSGSVPGRSLILAKRSGYRQLREFWQELDVGRRGLLADASRSIANRDIPRLYEFWCFFALADLLAPHLGGLQGFELRPDDRVGLEQRARARFGGGGDLWYNRGFRRPNSYSLGLRPDYTLLREGAPSIAFDAKFRFEPLLDEQGDEIDDWELGRTGRASVDDLYKMHTYRDALGLGSAIVLHPGTESVFYRAEAPGQPWRESLPVEDVLAGRWTGVGAIALRP